ncbi:MAG: acylneuraminate cytidylyltransferase family protein [Methanofastidiosum sp.]
MYKNKKIIALIPAKEKSTRLPNKNIKLMLGKPLVAWSIESALQSNLLDDIVVSTDSKQIKEIALQYGVKVLDRPKEFCLPESHIKETLKHTAQNIKTDYILMMNPTAPIRYSVDLFIQQFDSDNYDTAASGYECKIYPWGINEIANKQEIKPYFYDDGNFYIHKSDYILDGLYWCPNANRRQAIIVPQYMNYEIDTFVDWIVVEALMKKFFNGELTDVPI